MTTFEQLGIEAGLLQSVLALGFTEPTPIQEQAIPILLAGTKDFIGLASTGTGKTASFGLPLLQLINKDKRFPQALIICPTRELCIQITEDLKKFNAKTKLIVEQFNKYNVVDDKYVNGDATQGENIADLGGVVMGYEAFKKTKQYKENEKIAGLTPDQRFFLAYGYAWMVNIKTESLAQQLLVDVHSPAKYRINGPLANIPEFYKTFNVKQGNKMYRAKEKQITIW